MGRPPTKPARLRNGFYIEVKSQGSSAILIRRDTKEQQLVKENANRYTWEGRLTNFCPLKKIDKKILDKKLAMTYADFKKIQQCQQNKK